MASNQLQSSYDPHLLAYAQLQSSYNPHPQQLQSGYYNPHLLAAPPPARPGVDVEARGSSPAKVPFFRTRKGIIIIVIVTLVVIVAAVGGGVGGSRKKQVDTVQVATSTIPVTSVWVSQGTGIPDSTTPASSIPGRTSTAPGTRPSTLPPFTTGTVPTQVG